MKFNIDIDEKVGIDLKKIEILVMNACKLENIVADEIYVNIETVSKEKIKELNKNFRNVDKVTDVLSFPMYTPDELDNEKIKIMSLGDIILCTEKIKEQAVEYETGFEREMTYMIVHGLCHLLGYDHIEAEDKKIMREKEEKLIRMCSNDK